MNLFKKAIKSTNPEYSMENKTFNPDMDKFEKIFVTDKAPTEQAQDASMETQQNVEVKREENQLTDFINQDHFKSGNDDGYQHQSTDYMYAKIDELKGQFEWLIEQAIDQLVQEVNQVKIQAVKTADPEFQEVFDMLAEREIHIEESIGKLKTQVDLANAGGGIISRVLSAYKSGYFKGVKEYHEIALLGKSTGLFN
jgi:hypothetical protein